MKQLICALAWLLKTLCLELIRMWLKHILRGDQVE